jgi:DNA repair photolyase
MTKWGEQPELYFDESELNTDLGEGNFIFVGSSCDVFAQAIERLWIKETLIKCKKHNTNKYLFQSKNPIRFQDLFAWYPTNMIFGTTIETNRDEHIVESAPCITDRYFGIHAIGQIYDYPTMITIEPIMDFDLKPMLEMVSDVEPEWVNIGANTNHNVKLPEPVAGKIHELIAGIRDMDIEVKIKNNLKRLL